MEIPLKIKICKNKQFSIIISKLPELTDLINSLIHVLEVGCRNVVINNRETDLEITTFEDRAMLSTLQTFIEAAYFSINGQSKGLKF